MAGHGVQEKMFEVMSTDPNKAMGLDQIASASGLERIMIRRSIGRLKRSGRIKQLGRDQFIKSEVTGIKRTYTRRAGISANPGNTLSKVQRLLGELGQAISVLEENIMTPAQISDYERLQGMEEIIKTMKTGKKFK